MSHIKEPYGVDFVVENTPVTEEDKKIISSIITHYKLTGKKKALKNNISAAIQRGSKQSSKQKERVQ